MSDRDVKERRGPRGKWSILVKICSSPMPSISWRTLIPFHTSCHFNPTAVPMIARSVGQSRLLFYMNPLPVEFVFRIAICSSTYQHVCPCTYIKSAWPPGRSEVCLPASRDSVKDKKKPGACQVLSSLEGGLGL